jgi:hypothetical protein
MGLLYAARTASMLLPNQCDPEWMDLSRVFSDNVPEAAGIGASLIAQQALGLSPAAAAQLVSDAGASSIPSSQLAKARARPRTNARGANATRLPIAASVDTAIALINGDPDRTFMLIQNNNATGGANLLWSVDGQINTATPWAYVNLAPGLGILLDEEVFINPLYVAWGTGTVVGGMVLYGSSASAGPAPIVGENMVALSQYIQ